MSTASPVFLEFTIQNAYHIKGSYTINLEKEGLINLLGKNLDTSEVSSNGSGKSTVVRCFLRLLYGRKVTKGETATEALNGGDFLLGLKIKRNGKTYEIREVRKHSEYKKDGLYCFEDGKPFGLKNSGEQLRVDFVKKAIGMTFEEFIGSTVITQGSTHVLISGSPQERIEFISKIFGLNRYDELYEKFKGKHGEAEAKAKDFEKFRIQVDILKKRKDVIGVIDELPGKIAKLEKKAKRLKLKRRDLRGILDKDSNRRGAIESYNKALERLQAFKQKHGGYNFSKAKASLSELREEEKTLVKRHSKLEAILEKSENVRVLRQQRSNLRKSISKEHRRSTAEDVKESIKDLQKREAKLTQKLREQASKRELTATVRVNLQQLEQIGMMNSDYDESKAMWLENEENENKEQAIIDKCMATLEIKEGVDTHMAQCPTCGTVINAKLIEAEIAEAKAKMIAADRRRKRYHSLAQRHRLFCDTFDLIKKHDIDVNVTETDLVQRAEKIKVIRESIENLEEVYDKLQELDKINAQLSTFGDIEDIDASSITEVKSRLSNVQIKLDVFQRYLSMKSNVPEEPPSVLPKSERKVLEAELSTFDTELEEISTKIERYSSKVEEVQSIDKTLTELAPKLKQLKDAERDVRVLKALCDAYGKKGLKTRKIAEIVEAIKRRLPIWTSRLITQKGFRIDTIGNANKIGFRVHQSLGGKGKKSREKTYDIRNASTGEKTRLMIALILTIVDIIPEDKRCNILFLDEPEAGLDSVNRSLVSSVLIPMLKKRKPTLVVISHSLDVPRKTFDKEIIVTRKNAQATIETINLRKRGE